MNKQSKRKILTIALCSLFLFSLIVAGISYLFPTGAVSNTEIPTDTETELSLIESEPKPFVEEDGENVKWKGKVIVSKNGEVVYEGLNLLTDAGANHIKFCLGQGGCGTGAFDYIAVGNGSAPTTSSTSLDSEIAESGLSRASGTYTSLGTGHWKIEKIFSVTGTVNSINSTALFNASSSGTMIAGDTFPDTNVANGDSLNITWDVTQS